MRFFRNVNELNARLDHMAERVTALERHPERVVEKPILREAKRVVLKDRIATLPNDGSVPLHLDGDDVASLKTLVAEPVVDVVDKYLRAGRRRAKQEEQAKKTFCTRCGLIKHRSDTGNCRRCLHGGFQFGIPPAQTFCDVPHDKREQKCHPTPKRLTWCAYCHGVQPWKRTTCRRCDAPTVTFYRLPPADDQRKDDLDERERKLHDHDSELGRRERELAEGQRVVSERAHAQNRRERKLVDERERGLNERKDVLDARSEGLAERERGLDAREHRLRKTECKLNDRDEFLHDREQRLNDRERELYLG